MDGPNECGAVYDVEQGDRDYNKDRGDGSLGQVEIIGVDTPTDGVTY